MKAYFVVLGHFEPARSASSPMLTVQLYQPHLQATSTSRSLQTQPHHFTSCLMLHKACKVQRPQIRAKLQLIIAILKSTGWRWCNDAP